MSHRNNHVAVRALILAVLMVLTALCATAALAAEEPSSVDYLYEMSHLKGNHVPTETINLSEDADHLYPAKWTKVYEYTYTRKKMCTGDSSKRFKIALSANCYGDSSTNPRVKGTITVEMYNNSGKKVATWKSKHTQSPSLTGHFKPSSSEAYYYFKIKLSNCTGYSAGKLYISLAN